MRVKDLGLYVFAVIFMVAVCAMVAAVNGDPAVKHTDGLSGSVSNSIRESVSNVVHAAVATYATEYSKIYFKAVASEISNYFAEVSQQFNAIMDRSSNGLAKATEQLNATAKTNGQLIPGPVEFRTAKHVEHYNPVTGSRLILTNITTQTNFMVMGARDTNALHHWLYVTGFNKGMEALSLINLEASMKGEHLTFGTMMEIARERYGIPKP